MGSQEHRTPAVHSSISSDPVWNTSMQFLVKDFDDDVLCFTVKEKGNFSPDRKYFTVVKKKSKTNVAIYF